MFLACKPYRQYSLYCTKDILLADLTNFIMRLVDINDFLSSAYENENTGLVTFEDSAILLYDTENNAYLTDSAFDNELTISEHGNKHKVQCKAVRGVNQDLFNWYFGDVNVKISYDYSETKPTLYINNISIPHDKTVFGFNYAFMFRDVLVLRFTATQDLSIALNKDSQILSIWTADGNCIDGDAGLAVKIDTLSVY